MRFPSDPQSSQNEARDAHDTYDQHAVKESSFYGQSDGRINVTQQQTNKAMFANEENRQDISSGNEGAQQDLFNDVEFRLLYKEIE